MALTTAPNTAAAQPPLHFRPQSERQRLEVLRRIDAAEREALSEGTTSARAILRSVPLAEPMTPDPYRLRDGIPTLRVVEGGRRVYPVDPQASNARPFDADSPARLRQMQQPAAPQPAPHPHQQPTLNAFERRAVFGIVAIYLVAIVSVVAITIWARTP